MILMIKGMSSSPGKSSELGDSLFETAIAIEEFVTSPFEFLDADVLG
jgi:hypothetical protein